MVMSERFTAKILEGHKIMIPIECRRKLEMKPGHIYKIQIAERRSINYIENFLAKMHASGQVVIPKLLYDLNKLNKGMLVDVLVIKPEDE